MCDKCEIRCIEKDTDLSKVKMSKMGWDTFVYKQPHDVYRIDDYVHTLGGKMGENPYWCCPMGEKPTYENLMEFGGHSVCWGIEYKEYNTSKTKWGSTSVRDHGKAIVKRNGKAICCFGCRKAGYGLAKAQVALVELQEHPINFHDRDFMKEFDTESASQAMGF